MTISLIFGTSTAAFADPGHWGDWDVNPRGHFIDETRVGWKGINPNCDTLWRYAQLATATLDAGLRCQRSENLAWEIAPQVSLDNEAKGIEKVIPGLRLKAIGNYPLATTEDSTLALSLSYTLSPRTRQASWSQPGFKMQVLKRWMDVFDSELALALMLPRERLKTGWLFEVRQSVPPDLRWGGIAESSTLNVTSVGVEHIWWKNAWKVSAGLNGVSVIFDRLHILFFMPRISISYDFSN